MRITCQNCEYQWDYGGDLEQATCPNCRHKTPAENRTESASTTENQQVQADIHDYGQSPDGPGLLDWLTDLFTTDTDHDYDPLDHIEEDPSESRSETDDDDDDDRGHHLQITDV